MIFALLFSAAAAVAPDFNSIDAAARQFMSNTKTPGVAVAIVRGSDVVYAKGFGVASLDAPSPVTADTLFQIGSLTKVFTAATILSLAAQGKIRLDVPVGNYVSGLNPSIARLTASQLLSHTAGLKDEPAEYGSHDERAFAEYPRSWTSAYAILPPGTTFSYSNPGFTLAGLMAQETAGKPFPQLVEERVFTPLSMKHSTFRPTVAMTFPLAIGHRGARGETPAVVRPMAEDTRHWPAGYIYTSANDLARFTIALLHDKAFHDLMTPRVEVSNELEPARYGYGLFLETYRGIPTAWHGGDMPGFTAMMRVLPGEDMALIVLANRQAVRPDPILDALLEALHRAPQSAAPKSQPAIPMTAAEMKTYAGRYVNRFPIELFVRDGRLWVRRPDDEHAVEKIGEQRFTTDPARTFRPAEFEIFPATAQRPAYVNMFVWAFVKEQ